MAGAEEILIRIAMSGDDDVIAQLEGVGKAGEEAAGTLEKAFVDTAGVITGLVAGITGVLGGLGEWAKHSSNVTTSLGDLAKAAGDTIEGMSGLEGALASMGAQTDFLASAYRRLSFTIEAEWQQIRRTVKTESDKLINDQLAVASSALSVQSAEASLVKARQALAADQGVQIDPEILKLQKRQELIRAVAEAELKLQEAQQKQVEAAKKADDDRKNSLTAIGTAVQKVASGQESVADASKSANLEINNVIKGIILAAGPAGAEQATEGLKDFKGSLADIGTAAPPVQAVFFKLADFMKNSGDAALNTALSYRLLSRGVGQDVVQAMSKGSEAIKEQIETAKKLGLTLTETDEKAAKAFKASFNSLSSNLSTTITQIGNLFGPVFTEGFDHINEALKKNHQAIIDWAQGVVTAVTPSIQAIFKALSGEKLSKEGGDPAWVRGIVSAIQTISHWFSDVAGPAIKTFFEILSGEHPVPKWIQEIGTALESLAKIVSTSGKLIAGTFELISEAINKVFGTKISSGDVGIVALLGLILTRVNPVIAALTTVALLMGKLRESGGNKQAETFDLLKDRQQVNAEQFRSGQETREQYEKTNKDIISDFADYTQAIANRDEAKKKEITDKTIAALKGTSKEVKQTAEEVAADSQKSTDSALGKTREAAQETGKVVTEEQRKANANKPTTPEAEKPKPKSTVGPGTSEIPRVGGPQIISAPGASPETLTAKVVSPTGEGLAGYVANTTPSGPGSLSQGRGVVTAPPPVGLPSNAQLFPPGPPADTLSTSTLSTSVETTTSKFTSLISAVDGLESRFNQLFRVPLGTGGEAAPFGGAARPGETEEDIPEKPAGERGTAAIISALQQRDQNPAPSLIGQLIDAIKSAFSGTATAGGNSDNNAEKLDSTLGTTSTTIEGLNSSMDTLLGTVTVLASTISTLTNTNAAGALGGVIRAYAGGGIPSAPAGHNPLSGHPFNPGLIQGRGTGTSDSILARVSNGEYVVRAASVKKYGVSNMHHINNGTFPMFNTGGVVSLWNNLRRFNEGGFASSAFSMPTMHFAGGGPVPSSSPSSSGHPLTLVIDGTSFGGMTAHPNTVKALEAHATQRRMTSSGKKPVWYD